MSATERHRQAYAYCAYCPKVCRFACPVSASTKNEATSTWGKMSTAFLASGARRPLDEQSAASLYACTGCMRCRTFCKHENEVGWALFDAREMALDAHLEPAGAKSTRKTWNEHQNVFGRDLAELVAAWRAEAPVRYAFFPGCSSLVKRPGLIEDALEAADGLSAPLGVARISARCCGYPLYAAGDQAGFLAHALRFAEQLKAHPELVVLDPGCAYTLLVVYPRAGVELPSRIRTVYEVLASHLGNAPDRPKVQLRAAYHDACHLGRGLGQYDEPRALLAAAVGESSKARDGREQAGCSGGGGLLPRTLPEVSVDVARREALSVAPSGETVVTACPTSKRMFERAGRAAEDLLSVLRRWLKPRA